MLVRKARQTARTTPPFQHLWDHKTPLTTNSKRRDSTKRTIRKHLQSVSNKCRMPQQHIKQQQQQRTTQEQIGIHRFC
jgi:hypothetical protein